MYGIDEVTIGGSLGACLGMKKRCNPTQTAVIVAKREIMKRPYTLYTSSDILLALATTNQQEKLKRKKQQWQTRCNIPGKHEGKVVQGTNYSALQKGGLYINRGTPPTNFYRVTSWIIKQPDPPNDHLNKQNNPKFKN